MNNNSHYYTNNCDLQSKPRLIKYTYQGYQIELSSDIGVFSNERIDFGTNVLINNLEFDANCNDVLDIGCGYGIIGIALAKALSFNVLMSDVNDRAIELAKRNVLTNKVKATVRQSYLFNDISEQFDMIISNPPIRAGKSVVFGIVEEGFKHLKPDGTIWLVAQKKQGALSLMKKMEEVFGNVQVINKTNGYYVIRSRKVE